jgi:predicted DCC family thiol-disulfide oxidoreductase YuxK
MAVNDTIRIDCAGTDVKDYLLFDGDCGICSRSAEIAEKIDGRDRFVIAPYQMYPESELQRFGLDYGLCNRKMRVITRKCRVYSGAFGINYFLWQYFPWSLLVALIYLAPIFLIGELIVYRLVARYRHRISAMLGLRACLVKQRS